jgi:hypothetical protein
MICVRGGSAQMTVSPCASFCCAARIVSVPLDSVATASSGVADLLNLGYGITISFRC